MDSPRTGHPLQLYNTLTRKIEIFSPRRKDEVKMFTCGPSIYDTPHIGNYRTFLYEDILHRYLEYLGFRVNRLINFTDVEDKSIQRAEQDATTLTDLTGQKADAFYRAAGLLHIRLPDYIPRSSTSVDQAVRLVMKLLRKGYAYRHQGSIFYDPLKFKGFGKLAGLDMRKWPRKKRRYWKDTYPGNRWNLGDFILWHAYDEQRDGKVFWETELGRGRPAWNIQDPAMISSQLGFAVDICCGGVDNLFRHHDYTIAVLEGVSGVALSRFWLHGEHLLLDGRKMSKSSGNIIYPATLVDEGFTGTALRFHLIGQHYRKKINLTRASLAASRARLNDLRRLALDLLGPLAPAGRSFPETDKLIERLTGEFARHMSSDLHVGAACASLENNMTELVRRKNSHQIGQQQYQRIRRLLPAIDAVLQILFP